MLVIVCAKWDVDHTDKESANSWSWSWLSGLPRNDLNFYLFRLVLTLIVSWVLQTSTVFCINTQCPIERAILFTAFTWSSLSLTCIAAFKRALMNIMRSWTLTQISQQDIKVCTSSSTVCQWLSYTSYTVRLQGSTADRCDRSPDDVLMDLVSISAFEDLPGPRPSANNWHRGVQRNSEAVWALPCAYFLHRKAGGTSRTDASHSVLTSMPASRRGSHVYEINTGGTWLWNF